VRVAAGERGGFQLTFKLESDSPLNTLLLLLGQIGPFIRAIIVATVNGTPYVLMDGVVTQHQVTPDVASGKSILTVTGEDLTAVMDYVEFNGLPYPAMPPEARVALILAKYAVYGMIPLIIPSLFQEVPNPLDRIPSHRGTDLQYIEGLAEEAGYVFYVDPGPAPGTNLAYWGPEIKVGVPQPALNVNMDVHTNIESLNFRYDGRSGTLPVVYIQNQETRATIPIPVPSVSLLNPPLGVIPPLQAQVKFMPDTARLSPIKAVLRGLAEAAKSAEAVTGTGSLDVLRYGHILRARGLVGVRGAGQAFDGLYFVKNVTHRIKKGEYKQTFTLTRNGLVSTVPSVPT
jgi:hypothetical protein